MKNNNLVLLILLVFTILIGCGSPDNGALPILGKKKMVDNTEVEHFIPDWKFMNQDSSFVTNQDLKEYIYVSDFFFTSCPSICPKVKKEMLEVYDNFKDENLVKFVSFSLDPKRDSPEKLKLYSSNLNVDNEKWWFIHGEKETIYDLAFEYMVPAYEDDDAEGGIVHSGKIILVDRNGHIRSFSEGTDASTTPKLIDDINKLLKEINENKS